MKRGLHLYVWYGVLADWSAGIIFALAHDIDEARQTVLDAVRKEYANWPDPEYMVNRFAKEIQSEPEIHDDIMCFWVYGGS